MIAHADARRWVAPFLTAVLGIAACAPRDAGEPQLERFTGDYAEIQSRGQIRFLAPLVSSSGLPRGRTPLEAERRLAELFATLHGLEPQWVWVEDYQDLIPSLVDGRGDVIAANYTVTPEREATIGFASPIAQVREAIVSRRTSPPIATPADLVGRTISIRESSAFWATADSLAEAYPGIRVVPAPETSDTEELLYQVASGELDVTMADDLLVEAARGHLPDLRVDMTLGTDRDLAWGVRPANTVLRDTLNAFLARLTPEYDRPERYFGDLPSIRERKVLRVLTRNSPTSYFIWRGQLLGFEHDLMIDFAKSQGLNVEFIVTPTRAALFTWLIDGVGDLAAAGITRPDSADRLVSFTRSYNRVAEVVVTDSGDTGLTQLAQLAGRTLALRASSGHWVTATRLREQGIAVNLVPVPEELATEEILGGVARGEYDLTLVDSHILDMELTWRDDIRGAVVVADSVDHAWVTRPGDVELQQALNTYLDSVVRGSFYNVTKRKYFGNPKASRGYVTGRAERAGELSPYDDLTRRHASRYELDWVLITAQMYEESKFDPGARSFAGAVGLMQLMPKTAAGFGYHDLDRPDVNIQAGTRYLRHVWGLLDDVPDPEERMWFALASYNAGLGHINDARRIAREQGLDPNVWFDNVADVAPLLQREAIHRRAQYGYCRCSEPVAYVRKIRERHRAYELVASQR